jgi:hypothetical protein
MLREVIVKLTGCGGGGGGGAVSFLEQDAAQKSCTAKSRRQETRFE